MFELTQALALYDFYQTQVAQCDERIEVALRHLQTGVEPPTAPIPAARHRTKQPNGFAFDVRAALYGMLGVDLTQIHGLGPYVTLKLVAECGNDMSRWPTVKHFTSWLCLAPGNKISGGKILSSKTRRSSSKAAAALRLWFLSTPVSPDRQGQSCYRHRAQDCRSLRMRSVNDVLQSKSVERLRCGKEADQR
ncbi:IS110 family transposase, partial [Burkholderia sp. Bp8986]|uniref:IS110 family transposase n=1 Tax=Burkholderia sp. Bp8986 TaxID=2184550 RepID=UPI0021AB1D40